MNSLIRFWGSLLQWILHPSLIRSEITLLMFERTMRDAWIYFLGQLFILLIVDRIYAPYVPHSSLFAWNLLLVGNLVLRYRYLRYIVQRLLRRHRRLPPRIFRYYLLSLALSGILWAGMVLFLDYLPLRYTFFIYSLIMIMTFTATLSIGPILPFFLGFTLPMNLVMVFHLLEKNDPIFNLGALTLVITTVYSFVIARRRMREFARMIREKLQAQKLKEHFKELAHFDPLTGLPNRFAFFERFERSLNRNRKDENPFALLFLDLDRFKEINDTLGHTTGDAVLREVARQLDGTLDRSCFAARLAGDEFVVLLPGVATPEQALEAAHALQSRFHSPLRIGDRTLTLRLSIGIVLFPRDGTDSDLLLSRADEAMYISKKEGVPVLYCCHAR